MFSRFERMLALRYLRSKRKEKAISLIAWLAFGGISLGVATLIVVMAVMSGFRQEITSKILGVHGHIAVSAYNGGIENYDALIDTVKGVKHVVSAVPIIDGQAMATTEFHTTGTLVRGISKQDIKHKSIIANNIVEGDLAFFEGRDVIMIGTHLANSLGVRVGDDVTLISPQGNATAFGTMPRLKSYEVVALFESGMFEYDNTMMFLPLEAASVFFRVPEGAKSIEVVTDDPFASSIIVKDIIRATGNAYQVYDWQMLNSGLMNALKVEKSTMRLILALVIFIASFNIVSSMVMLVNDKRKSIATLRTIGATRGMMLRIFFMCGSLIGIIGTLAGVVLGIVFATYIEEIRQFIEMLVTGNLFDPRLYFLPQLPHQINAGDVVTAIMVGIACSFIATLYPAYKASRQEPVEVLRYE